MHYYDAELLRLRGQTHHDTDARQADVDAAIETARRQVRPSVVEAVARFPSDSAWPELAQAKALLS